MDDAYILENMLLTKHFGFNDKEIATMARNAVQISWASEAVKHKITEEIDAVYERFYPSQ